MAKLTDTLQQSITAQAEIVALRRALHQHPELSFQEFDTARTVGERLAQLGYAVRHGVASTGVVADMGCGNTVALSSELGALPIAERSALSWASATPGVMHAFGHDANMACTIAAAKIIAGRLSSGADGKVRIIMQPGAESVARDGKSGARHMIDGGALQGVSAILGLHVDNTLAAGHVGIVMGPSTGTAGGAAEEILYRTACDLLGIESVRKVSRRTWCEGFSDYVSAVPGAYIYLGTKRAGAPSGGHSHTFDIDESALYLGAALLAEAACNFLAAPPLRANSCWHDMPQTICHQHLHYAC